MNTSQTRYVLSPRASFRVVSPREVAASVRGIQHALPMDLYRLALEFAEPRSVTEVHGELDTDASVADVAGLVELLAGRGIVDDHAPPVKDGSLSDLLSDRYRSDPALLSRVGGELASGRAVLLTDAMDAAFAERAHASLAQSTSWRVHEQCADPFFHYHHHNIYDERDFTPELDECNRVFAHPRTKGLVSRLAGRDCGGRLSIGASLYLPGDYSLPHSDGADARSVAFVWYLTKDWKPEWGGHFVWCPTGAIVAPSFNALLMFVVEDASLHFVSQVSPHARGQRLAINGWWHAEAKPAAQEPSARASWPVELAPGTYGAGTRVMEGGGIVLL